MTQNTTKNDCNVSDDILLFLCMVWEVDTYVTSYDKAVFCA
jgi:hypothetical protein